jgi:beta-phosphoglucomutase
VIKACIFDLDGVIVDTAHYHFLAWQKLASELKVNFTLDDNERLKGVSRMESLAIILQLGDLTFDDATKERLAAKKNAWFVDYINAMTPDEIYPGVRDLLKSMRTAGQRIALASSSKNALTVVAKINIKEEFDAIVDGNMIQNTKPNPEIFLLAADMLKMRPSDCLVFEDAEAGVEAALRAKMKCIGVGSPLHLGKANLVFPYTADFKIDLLNSL